jgi:hypothetical protein
LFLIEKADALQHFRLNLASGVLFLAHCSVSPFSENELALKQQ